MVARTGVLLKVFLYIWHWSWLSASAGTPTCGLSWTSLLHLLGFLRALQLDPKSMCKRGRERGGQRGAEREVGRGWGVGRRKLYRLFWPTLRNLRASVLQKVNSKLQVHGEGPSCVRCVKIIKKIIKVCHITERNTFWPCLENSVRLRDFSKFFLFFLELKLLHQASISIHIDIFL